MSLLCLFHFGEFFVTAVHQPNALKYDSFVVNHSKSYTAACLLSWLEFWLEAFLFGKFKRYISITMVGIFLVVTGQAIRSTAMWQCGKNFSHLVMQKRSEDHQLVTTGIYSILRHPSYFGWFYWSIGTQLILCNPFCFILYTIVSWLFFADRIPNEENLLNHFYGDRYKSYTKRTIIGIPFIQ